MEILSVLDLFSKGKTEPAVDQKKWNKMWELWSAGQAASPYAELMTYQSEINNGGHWQYFFNVENTGGLRKEIAALDTVLPNELKKNLKRAYKAYLASEESGDDDAADEVMERCDDVFYEQESDIERLLKEYAAKLEI